MRQLHSAAGQVLPKLATATPLPSGIDQLCFVESRLDAASPPDAPQPSLQARLARGCTRRSRDKVEAGIARILQPRWVDQIITVALTGESPAKART